MDGRDVLSLEGGGGFREGGMSRKKRRILDLMSGCG